ncbi:MAG: S-methyl-5'-thioadenosine phosphorylase [archaeon]
MIGLIGGSGLEDPKILQNSEEIVIETPHGAHSPIKIGTINQVKVALVSRHGYKHEFSPTKVPYKANIFALKMLACKAIIATSACGSLREDIAPGTFSFPSQIIDRTTLRDQSFSTCGDVIHESMAEPFNANLRNILVQTAKRIDCAYGSKTTLITIEGPRFSTRAESELFRSWNCDLINMTTVPEVFLAKEMKLPYQVINLVTDYDCWHEGKVAVTFDEVMRIMQKNSEKVKKLIIEALPEIEKNF